MEANALVFFYFTKAVQVIIVLKVKKLFNNCSLNKSHASMLWVKSFFFFFKSCFIFKTFTAELHSYALNIFKCASQCQHRFGCAVCKLASLRLTFYIRPHMGIRDECLNHSESSSSARATRLRKSHRHENNASVFDIQLAVQSIVSGCVFDHAFVAEIRSKRGDATRLTPAWLENTKKINK